MKILKSYNSILFISIITILLSFSSCTKKAEKAPIENQAAQSASTHESSSANTNVTSSPTQLDANPGKTFTYRLLGDPETLDWNRAHTSVETHLLINLMEGLVSYDENMNIIPALAEKWTKSADGKTYTFKIRPGVKWSDGVPLTAKDFLFSWKRLLSPVTSASYAYLLFEIEGAEDYYKGTVADFSKVGITAPDDQTFVVKLKNPVAYFLHIPSFWVTFPLREDIVTQYGNSWAKPGRMVTLGAFTLSSYDMDSRIVFKANPLYYGKKGNVDTAVGLIVKEDSTALTLFETGKLDFLNDLSSSDMKRLEKSPLLKSFPYLKTAYIGFVHAKFPMSNAHFRRALSMAVDRSQIPSILHGDQTAAAGFLPKGMEGYDPSAGVKFDPVQAKKELKLSGYDIGTKTPIEFICPNWEKAMTTAQFIQGEIKKNLGIELQIQAFDHKTFRAQLELQNYPIFLSSWSADYPDADNFMSIFLSGVGNNRTSWKNASYDQKVLSARTEQNQKKRMALYAEAQKILTDTDSVVLPLYHEPILALVQKRVGGIHINPVNYFFMRKIDLKD